jgi:hypothetical protein
MDASAYFGLGGGLHFEGYPLPFSRGSSALRESHTNLLSMKDGSVWLTVLDRICGRSHACLRVYVFHPGVLLQHKHLLEVFPTFHRYIYSISI